MTSYFLKNGNRYRVTTDDALDLHETLPVGTYFVRFSMDFGFYLESTDDFRTPNTIYGSTERDAERILKTFEQRSGSTGCLLCGSKGSGKTLLAKLIASKAAEKNIPTLIVNAPFQGDNFNTFLATITQEVVVVFDEFEKVYEKDDQKGLLTILDGVVGNKKLYVMTANDLYRIEAHLKNRPGRFYYLMEFKGVTQEFIREYCELNLVNQDYIEKIVILSTLFYEFNFDMLQALVEECNRFGEDPTDAAKYLNVKPETGTKNDYNVSLEINGVVVEQHCYDDGWEGNPLDDDFRISYSEDTEQRDWKTIRFRRQDITEFDARKGVVVYKSEEGKVTLTRQKAEEFSYRDLLAL